MYFDAHNHLNDDWLKPHHAVLIPQLSELGVAGMVVNGSSEADWDAVDSTCAHAPWLKPSYGIHPWDCGNRGPHYLEALRARLLATPHAAVGEIGIDRWILDRAKPDDPRLAGLRRAPLDEQIETFLAQLQLATELGRAASIHCLDAYGALLEALRSVRTPAQGFLLHSYAGAAELVPSFCDLGAYFSFNLTFLEARRSKARETWKNIPLNRVLVETDAPAIPPPPEWARHSLPPGPNGETLNHPANICSAYEGLAQLRGMPLVELQTACANNFQSLFGR